MSKYLPAVVAFREGADHVHWFPVVIIEVENSTDMRALGVAVSLIQAENVLDWDEELEDFTEYDRTYTPQKIEKLLKDQGFQVVGVHKAEHLTYIAPLEDY